jgi:hypothetical protein
MTKQTKKEKAKVEEVMHEFKNGTLMSGKDGKGGKVKKRKQAIAIALSEASHLEDKAEPEKANE